MFWHWKIGFLPSTASTTFQKEISSGSRASLDDQIIRAQGTSKLDKADVLEKAKSEAHEAAARLANKATV